MPQAPSPRKGDFPPRATRSWALGAGGREGGGLGLSRILGQTSRLDGGGVASCWTYCSGHPSGRSLDWSESIALKNAEIVVDGLNLISNLHTYHTPRMIDLLCR